MVYTWIKSWWLLIIIAPHPTIGRDQRLHEPASQLSVDHSDQVPIPEAQQPGSLGQANKAGVALRRSPRRIQVQSGPHLDCGPLAQVFQPGPDGMDGRRDTPSVRDRAGQRTRSTAHRSTSRGHLRRGLDAGAQLRAQLLQDVHERRAPVNQDRGRSHRQRWTPVHLVHRRTVGHRTAARPSGRYEILRLQVS